MYGRRIDNCPEIDWSAAAITRASLRIRCLTCSHGLGKTLSKTLKRATLISWQSNLLAVDVGPSIDSTAGHQGA